MDIPQKFVMLEDINGEIPKIQWKGVFQNRVNRMEGLVELLS